ncbi:hypothetical protein Rsub_03512 [Raphidocelis subcapitata]|uniref:Amino acid transporter transmembrane domain-containing protein n=1 Tax=Raphidocelis subcapitata TaxID=307507 RepID=A0A2V0NSB1_9CHLO|nr:hypothetical protein Rsub_03512 [Raphidocelis subcapitata]|eukprot:GBF90516.1 hypothetical protein Rsub_03512 [Raphidocelis subcapitata]
MEPSENLPLWPGLRRLNGHGGCRCDGRPPAAAAHARRPRPPRATRLPPPPARRRTARQPLAATARPNLQRRRQEVCISTNTQTLFNLVNVIMGAGFVSMPYACRMGGWASLAVVWALCAVFAWTGTVVLDCCRRVDAARAAAAAAGRPPKQQEGAPPAAAAGGAGLRRAGYEDTAEAAFGPVARRIVSGLMYAELLGICIVYFVLEAEALSTLLAHTPAAAALAAALPPGANVFAAASAALIIPTVLLPDLAALSGLGALSVAAALSLGAALALLWWAGPAAAGAAAAAAGSAAAVVPATLPQVLGIVAFVYAGHSTFPVVQQSMRRPGDAPRVLVAAYVTVAAICSFVGWFGYATYGATAADVITANLPKGAPLTLACVMLTAVSPFAAFALTLEPVALALQRAFVAAKGGGGEAPYALRAAVRLGLAAVCAAAAAVLPHVADLMALVGAVLTTSISLMLPAAARLVLAGDELSPGGAAAAAGVMLLGAAIAVVGARSALGSLAGKVGGAAAVAGV